MPPASSATVANASSRIGSRHPRSSLTTGRRRGPVVCIGADSPRGSNGSRGRLSLSVRAAGGSASSKFEGILVGGFVKTSFHLCRGAPLPRDPPMGCGTRAERTCAHMERDRSHTLRTHSAGSSSPAIGPAAGSRALAEGRPHELCARERSDRRALARGSFTLR